MKQVPSVSASLQCPAVRSIVLGAGLQAHGRSRLLCKSSISRPPVGLTQTIRRFSAVPDLPEGMRYRAARVAQEDLANNNTTGRRKQGGF
jgi:hypothetical protein